jgi:hypothetical protein
MTRRSPNSSKLATGSGKKPRSSRKSSTERRIFQVHQDMLKNSNLSFTRASRRRRIDPRKARDYSNLFRKDSSGRIRAYAVPRRQKTLYIPWFEPGEVKPIPTKGKADRRWVGRWMAALNAAGRDDWSKMDKFPEGKRIGGVLLPTKRAEVQRILVSLADRESPFEGLYRTIARRR